MLADNWLQSSLKKYSGSVLNYFCIIEDISFQTVNDGQLSEIYI
jgi:hypothetical protein